jgi:hypothetical protein
VAVLLRLSDSLLVDSSCLVLASQPGEHLPEDRRWTYGRIRLKVFGHSDGTIVATWAFGGDASVISEYAHEDEGNAYLRSGEVLTKLGREDEAREAYGAGIGQAEKFGHSGMAEDLRLAQVQLGG